MTIFKYLHVQLHFLNLNRVQHMVVSVALCEGYLGIEPNLTLWRYFLFTQLLRKKEEKRITEAWPIGCASIRLRSGRSHEYIPIPLSLSNKG